MNRKKCLQVIAKFMGAEWSDEDSEYFYLDCPICNYTTSIDDLLPVMDKLGVTSFRIESRGNKNAFQTHMHRGKIFIRDKSYSEISDSKQNALASAVVKAIVSQNE